MASIVPGLTMSEVRRCLQEIRRSWSKQSPWVPFNPSAQVTVVEGFSMSLTKFAWLFVSGHHVQRKRQRIEKQGARNESMIQENETVQSTVPSTASPSKR